MTNQKIQSFMNIYSKLMSKKKKLFNRFSSKMNYISTINAKFNPDILVGTLL